MCKKDKTIADIWKTIPDDKKELAYSIICNDEENLSIEDFLEKYKGRI